MRGLAPIALLSAALIGCGDEAPAMDPEACAPAAALAFRADPGAPGSEAYVCFGFDPAVLASSPLRSIRIGAPVPGAPVTIHHVSLYAQRGDFPDGPVRCEDMPAEASSLFVGIPGGDPLSLPEGVALVLPEGTKRLVVQAHVIRLAEGEAPDGALHLCGATGPFDHLAAWMPLHAPVPAIRPHHEETSTARCASKGALHLFATWPHMHRIGAAFHGAIVASNGARRAFVDVDPWRFEEQRVHPLDEDVAAGDTLETTCVWDNPGSDYVFPGPGIADEMCGQALVVWPADAASCAP